ncbi:hypothetical protein [Listeria ivanovii]|uniref:hypothetical protein n=1 Tax=Listeria ivanovii TaxID=1638 RepID=UPI00065E7D32|nr:hypothetical protein [Listeria ivanovii]
MKNFLLRRTNNRYFYISLALISILPFFNILSSFQQKLVQNQYPEKLDLAATPYTLWLGNSYSSGYSVLFFLILPIIVSIPTISYFSEDRLSGFHFFSRYFLKDTKYKTAYFLMALCTGFTLPVFILIINFLTLFLVWPNLPMDAIFNMGIQLDDSSMLWANLFYQHPFFQLC